MLPLLPRDECLSFLPLSHVFERMAGHYCMMASGTVINYASSIEAVPAEMIERRPTIVFSVPRLFEKIYSRVLENALSGSAVKKRLFFWAKQVWERVVEYRLSGRSNLQPLIQRAALVALEMAEAYPSYARRINNACDRIPYEREHRFHACMK